MTIADFRTDLDYSNDNNDEPFWQAVYRHMFPTLVRCEVVTNMASQYAGIDREIELRNGDVLRAQEKKLRHVYPHIFLETVSNDRTRSPGWIRKDLQVDFLAYAFMPILKVYFLSWPLLKRAWDFNADEWQRLAVLRQDNFREVSTRNDTYTTHGIAVPIQRLYMAMHLASIVQARPRQRVTP